MTTRHRAILASAGTGKTHRLTSRLIELLLSGESPDCILATTFTRKAAGEIRQRVIARLHASAVDERVRRALSEELGRDGERGFSASECERALAALIASLHRASIETLDAFMARSLGTIALDVGLPPGWRILDEANAAEVKLRVTRDVVASLGEPGVVSLLAALRESQRAAAQGARGEEPALEAEGEADERGSGAMPRSVGRSVRAGLDKVLRLRDQTRARPELWDFFAPRTSLLDSATLARCISQLESAPVPETKQRKPNTQVAKAKAKLLTLASEAEWGNFLLHGLASVALGLKAEFARCILPEAFVGAVRPLAAHASAVVMTRLRDKNRALRDLLLEFDARDRATKLGAGEIQFDDLARLLENASMGEKLDWLYFRLDARLRHVLLDEFQDTSREQFRVLEPLLDELLAEGDGSRSVFVVGDAKQSLYGWRSAEPDLLPAIVSRYEQFGPPLRLAASRRSAQEVLDFVNTVFTGLLDNPVITKERDSVEAVRGAAKSFSDQFQPHTCAPGRASERLGFVRVLTHGPSETAEQRREQAARAAIEHAEVWRRAAPDASIAILVRTGQMIAPLVYGLRERGLDAIQEGGNPVIDTPAVAVVVSMLRVCIHPGDSAAAIHVASSPLGPVVGLETSPRSMASAAPSVAARWRERIASRGLAPTIRQWREALVNDVDAPSAERLEQLEDLATEWESRGFDRRPPALDSFISYVGATPVPRRASPGPSGSPSIVVSTIHAAKGLEYDVVILCDLDRQWSSRDAATALERRVDADGQNDAMAAPSAMSVRPSKAERIAEPMLEAMHRDLTARELREQLCVLYVALTRAANVLEVIIPPDPEDPEPAPQQDPDLERATDEEPKKKAPKQVKAILSAAGVIRGALGFADHLAGGRTVHEHSRSTMAQVAASLAREHVLAPSVVAAGEPPAATSATPLLRRSRRAAARPITHLPRLSPSECGEPRTIRASELVRARGEGARLGSVVHGALEQVEWLEDARELPEPPWSVRSLASVAAQLEVPLSQEEAALLSAQIEAAMAGPIGGLLSRQRYAGELGHVTRGPRAGVQVRRESPFLVRVRDGSLDSSARASPAEGKLLSGRFDRVVLVFGSDGLPARVDVIDFKTDQAENAREVVQAYSAQMRAYRVAASRVFGVPPERVSLLLALMSLGVVETVA
ncbi:MAG: UvrD-helicase domain-containing protein [Planctomycetota bacterium]|nr:UvrD-helicase domain-containing protein [Planctomycetota bacterium]